jgi:hypothetical protein
VNVGEPDSVIIENWGLKGASVAIAEYEAANPEMVVVSTKRIPGADGDKRKDAMKLWVSRRPKEEEIDDG